MDLINDFVIEDARIADATLSSHLEKRTPNYLASLSIITDFYRRHQNVFDSTFSTYNKWNEYFVAQEYYSINYSDEERLKDYVSGGAIHIKEIARKGEITYKQNNSNKK